MNNADILELVDKIREQLVRKYKPEKIILFGSAASDNNESNDIDLLIIKKDVPYYGADRVMEVSRLMEIDCAIDYIIFKPEEVEERLSLGDPFIKNILSMGKVLYG